MSKIVRIGLVGDYDDTIVAHQAIPRALGLYDETAELTWLPTKTITRTTDLTAFNGLWCVPGSPYESLEGALRAIQFARENQLPFLGTCGGCQHAIIEYARHVLGWAAADHAETAPNAPCLVVSLLSCALVEATQPLRLLPGSRISAAYGALEATETYRCRYGPNETFRDALFAGALKVSAEDTAGEARAIELDNHPFFVATLFQPERAALTGKRPPLVGAFFEAALDHFQKWK